MGMVGRWRDVRYKEIHNLYPSANISTVLKLRKMTCGHVACMAKLRYAYRVC